MQAGGFTEPGLGRPHNEDHFGYDLPAGVAVLADGAGNRPHGEVAASLAVETVLAIARNHHGADHTWLESGGEPRKLAQLANQALLAHTESNRRHRGMGSTLALLCVAPAAVSLALVGDSPAYRLRDGQMTALGPGDAADQALGEQPRVQPDLHDLDRAAGDLFLLCSDGVSSALDDEALCALLMATQNDLAASARQIVLEARQAGGEGDASALLVRLD
ncbi:PP2C family protein-serine/threonine phosphatase [Alkalilimnicola ehrlichii MLHE-1]|uniref:Protein serine/threonine phosphatase n=1 Tax=Alkalilimnicola ehrlichii (strain ATCC BAA-1101 / DSM 17681 / MLHE-1) TaxID=187272 RepID=Q0ABA8_ALKEH|nr:protein phosphatase 2C domain-containing protein [Alkalilimnicola ehrlichii]ABI55879.1 protein serine/threonine phosphatase [Alkalilimnicola ehrlichii MLHE-1]